jgi:hypothetical protein
VTKFESISNFIFPFISTPGNKDIKLHKRLESEEAANQEIYRMMVGVLQYIALASRPDITYSTNRLSRYMNDSSTIHFQQAKQVFATSNTN